MSCVAIRGIWGSICFVAKRFFKEEGEIREGSEGERVRLGHILNINDGISLSVNLSIILSL